MKTIPLKNSGLIGADITVGATQVTLNPLPSVTSGYITLDSGNASKTEEVSFSHSGSNPVAISATTKAHTNGAQWLIDNTNGYYQEVVTGSGFNLNNNVIPAKALATNTILLGSAKTTTNQTGIATEAALTGLSLTVTVPAGGRSLLLVAQGRLQSSVADNEAMLRVKEGANELGCCVNTVHIINRDHTFRAESLITPTAGSHTYTATLQLTIGSGTLASVANSTYPAIIYAYLV